MKMVTTDEQIGSYIFAWRAMIALLSLNLLQLNEEYRVH